MSRLVHISVKDKKLLRSYRNKALNFLLELQPNDIHLKKEIILENNNSVTFILNPTKAVKVQDYNVIIGLCYSENHEEWLDFNSIPDGNFVIKREDDEIIEFVTDFQATKSLWYYFDDEILLVSSSQRMIIHLLGSFELNEQAVMWMLSSGTLGYKNSWDKRIKSIEPSTILTLEKKRWKIELFTEPIRFKSNNLSIKQNLKLFNNSIRDIFDKIPLKNVKPVLAITGGYDSRIIYLYLKQKYPKISLMTFGVAATLNINYSDLYISKIIASRYNHDWLSYDLDIAIEDLDSYFDWVIKLGEARIDVLERIIDGSNWMSDLFEKDFDCVINGMVGFSSQKSFNSERLNLMSQKLNLLSDYNNIPDGLFTYKKQLFPQELKKIQSESYSQYFNRINQMFFKPYADSALNEILNCYLDTLNPLITKSILEQTRNFPDKQRDGKKILKELVQSIDDSNIPFSNRTSVIKTTQFVKQESFSKYFDNYLLNNNNDILPKKVVGILIEQTKKYTTNKMNYSAIVKRSKLKGIKSLITKKFPTLVHKYIKIKKSKEKLDIDYSMLKYRMFLIVKMVNTIKNDLKNDL